MTLFDELIEFRLLFTYKHSSTSSVVVNGSSSFENLEQLEGE